MARVLIANLGESPVVIAALADALAARGSPVERVEVLYPGVSGERWIGEGFRMLAAHLDRRLPQPVDGEKLPFADAATQADCLAYLRALCARLERHERAGAEVILGISGGRKHTSALMAVPALFYRCVAALVHLHDRDEQLAGSQLSAHQLFALGDLQRERAFRPPAERFTLIDLPYGRLSDGPALRRWLAGAEQGERPPPVVISPRARSFYAELFGDQRSQGAEADVDGGRPLELIATLGDAPMVVTQAHALLVARGVPVAGIRAVYPRRNGAIEAGARRLVTVCRLRGVPLALTQVEIADLSGPADVPPFVAGLRAAVAEARAERPGAEPALLLSGGRKGMAALALAVAQADGLRRVYHTTIPSPTREAEVMRAYERSAVGSHARLAELMFLDGADTGDFALVEVPIVPLAPA